mmetsp:Transcript_84494/g.243959  ORF Transcript_84494/g.243959 Transcript_84494/m.243959 type:complete len:399 (+) Transcript_84494:81-1277(+)
MGCAHSGEEVLGAPKQAGVDEVEVVAAGDFHVDHIVYDKLGSGSFGAVYGAHKARNCNRNADRQLAVKVVDLRDEVSRNRGEWGTKCRLDSRWYMTYRNEVHALRKVAGHENTCQIFGKYMQGGLAYILMERCDRTLHHALDRLPALNEAVLRPYFAGMLKGLSFVHLRGLMHRDVKPSNFMCSGANDTVKLCDFGMAKCFMVEDHASCVGLCGTAAYMAPEILAESFYGPKVDIWALGCTVYVLCFGRFPYKPDRVSCKGMKQAILAGTPAPSFAPAEGPAGVSPQIVQWMQTMLARSPDCRPTCFDATIDFEALSSRSASTTCLQPMLRAAKRAGAFGTVSEGRSSRGVVDFRVRELQALQHPMQQQETCQLAVPASEASTEPGSSPSGSKQAESP